MKKQLVFIHGGQAYSNYEAFLEHLRTCDVDDPFLEVERKRWQSSLRSELVDTHDVAYLSMPNKQNAKYEEWKIWFERYHQFLRDGVVLMGHSQGGYFLLKYLIENVMPVRISAVYLLAAPCRSDDFGGEDGGDFVFDLEKVSNVAKQAEHIYILHSQDDPVVPYSHAQRLHEVLPEAELVTFTDKNHFRFEEFPSSLPMYERIRSGIL